MPRFTNLLEGVAPQNAKRELKRLLERMRRGDMSLKVGVLLETMGSDMFAALTADLMHKRALKGFMKIPNGDAWRKLVSSMSSPTDFRLQNAVAVNDLGKLEDVPASGKYKELVLFDEKTNYRVAKKGNIIAASLEAQANDELNQIGNSGEKLGAAGKRSLLNFVFNTLIDANPTLGRDSVALFHANHSNNLGASTPLNLANLESACVKLMTQTNMDGEPCGLMPRYLVVHPQDWFTAQALTKSAMKITATGRADAAATTTFEPSNNVFQGMLEVIVSQYVTAGRWYVAADPNSCDTIEVGFYQGRQEPEIFKEQAGSQAEFDTDSTRWKVRYIFGGAVLDFRWIVRGNAA